MHKKNCKDKLKKIFEQCEESVDADILRFPRQGVTQNAATIDFQKPCPNFLYASVCVMLQMLVYKRNGKKCEKSIVVGEF